MLAVQVQYWNMVENKRHNLETERQGAVSLAIDKFNAETNRMNAYTNEYNAQTNRYNAETNRLNYGETVRHNLVSEQLQREANTINAYNAESNRMNAETNRAMIPIQASIASAQLSQAATAQYKAYEDVRIQDERTGLQKFQNVTTYINNSRSVDIAGFNAETNRINSSTNAYNAETERTFKEGQLDVMYINADINQQNTDINRQRMENEKELKETELDLKRVETRIHGLDVLVDGITNMYRRKDK